MKSVLISIQPKWCELIISKEKTVEIRKNIPKLSTPFKCYIYETQGRKFPFGVKVETVAKYDDERFLDAKRGMPAIKKDKNGKPYFSYGRMKVMGEFICDNVEDYSLWEYDYSSLLSHIDLYAGTKGDYPFLDSYLKGKKSCFGWHISDLIIYDNPKEVSEFCGLNGKHVVRPPQSWMYVK